MRSFPALRLVLLATILFTLPAMARADEDTSWLHEKPGARMHKWWGDANHPKHRELQRMTFANPHAMLAMVDLENGGAEIQAWSQDEVSVAARIEAQAPTEDEAVQLARKVRIVREGGTLRAEGPPAEDHRSWSVVFHLLVPRQSDLKVRTQNGPVSIEGVKGKIDVATVNGPMDLKDLAGDVVARLENGPLSVDLDGSKWDGKGLDAETTNGPLSLSIPRDYSARLVTGTIAGPCSISLDHGGAFRSGRWNTYTLGAGGAPVRVVTTNGPAQVKSSRRPM